MQQKSRRTAKIANRIKTRASERLRKPIPRAVVPSFFTLMNALCGFLSILLVHEGALVSAAWLILLAGFFDAIDGYMARLTKGTSDFGIELDSLSDVISFGVAPGFLMYEYGLKEQETVGMLIAALPTLCGAVRLARFNVLARAGVASDHFTGLPIPAQAGMLVSFFLMSNPVTSFFTQFVYGINGFIIPLVIVLSLLMISTVPFDKIPRINREYVRIHKRRVVLFGVYILASVVFRESGVLAVFTVFILKGISQFLINLYRMMNSDDDLEEEDSEALGQ